MGATTTESPVCTPTGSTFSCVFKAVRFGNYKEYYRLDNKLYVYSRETEDQKILVVCSFSEKETKIKIPSGFDLAKAKKVLGNYENEGNLLKPYETRVYLFK